MYNNQPGLITPKPQPELPAPDNPEKKGPPIPKNPKVESYIPSIVENWNEQAKRVQKLPDPPAMYTQQPVGLGTSLQSYLEKTRYELLNQVKKEYENKYSELQKDMELSKRIISIQNGIMGRLYQDPNGRSLLLRVLDDAGITHEELELLASGGE